MNSPDFQLHTIALGNELKMNIHCIVVLVALHHMQPISIWLNHDIFDLPTFGLKKKKEKRSHLCSLNVFIIGQFHLNETIQPDGFQTHYLATKHTICNQNSPGNNFKRHPIHVRSLKFSSSFGPPDKILFHKIVHKIPQIYHWFRIQQEVQAIFHAHQHT